MTSIIRMPKLSNTMTEGVINNWLKKEGDIINIGDTIAEINTDKISMELKSKSNGILIYIKIKEKIPVKINSIIAIIKNERITKSKNLLNIEKKSESDNAKLKKKKNLFRKIKVSKKNIINNKISNIKKKIINKVLKSKLTIPHFYLNININMNKLIKIKNNINKKISFNDIIIKATSMAIRNNIKMNTMYIKNKIKYNKNINIGTVIASKNGPIIPIIKFADKKSILNISKEMKKLILKIKIKKLTIKDCSEGTFTISNLGMFNINKFSAIINPPEACILGIGKIQEIPIIKNKKIESGYLMKVNLSCDHRIIDGTTGSEFLKNLKEILENPIKMIFS